MSSSAKSAGRLSDIRRMESFASCLTVYPTLSQFQAADYDSIEDETLYDFNEIYSSGMVSLLKRATPSISCWDSQCPVGTACPLCADRPRDPRTFPWGHERSRTVDPDLWDSAQCRSAAFRLWPVHRMVFRRHAKVHQQLLFLRCLYSAADV